MKPIPQLSDYKIPDTNELETRIISSIVNDSTTIPEFMRMVKSEMFSNLENRKVWETIMDMYNNHEEVNMVTVLPKVDKDHFVNNIISAPSEFTYSGISGLLGAFVDTYVKRCAYITSVDTLQKINSGVACMTISDSLDGFKENVMSGFKDSTAKSSMDIANSLAEKLMKGESNRVPTSIHSVDYYTYGGFGGGNLVILAARPSVGKTTIGLQMALNASEMGKKTMIFSLEMSSEELVQRLILSTGYITPMDFFTKNFDWNNYNKAVREVTNENLIINEKSNSVDEICQKIRVACQTDGCKFVMIDYLGLIPITNSRQNVAVALGEITRKIKLTAKECNIPILLLCQLNRQSASENRSPQLYDLRDSGAIEQDADMVIMLEKAKDDMGAILDNTIDLWIRKNRNGKCNFDNPIRLIGNDNYTNFYEG